ncbi:MAG TPA: hypothetical protein DCR40_15035 [Prolixibacteraceae bacterium]|nr:hypothetical protein [Prolixibacteraceae bacterium]
MKKNLIVLLFILTFKFVNAQSQFYRQYWAVFDNTISNLEPGERLRVNDADMSLHETFWGRAEIKSNGLQLINVPEILPLLEKTEFYAELWGGHPWVESKRFSINGKSLYYFQPDGTDRGNCGYSYPMVQIKTQYLVNGINAFQFACDRGKTFWGHYIIDNMAVRCFLKADHPDLKAAGLNTFSAIPVTSQKVLADQAIFYLDYPKELESQIVRVHYFAHYLGYDDNGNLLEDDWHGYTFKKEFKNHMGTSGKAPYSVTWNTGMLPNQSKPMSVKALVELKNGFFYQTNELNSLSFPKERSNVQLYRCTEMPHPFWSRDKDEKLAVIELPDDISKIETAQIWVRIWDGGEGNVRDPFTINGFPYSITTGKAPHEVVFRILEVKKENLNPGKNIIRLFSDTKEHGIEMLLPGPCLLVKYKNK